MQSIYTYLLTKWLILCAHTVYNSSAIQMVLGIITHNLFQESWRLDACWEFCWIAGVLHCRRLRSCLRQNKAKMQQMHQSETSRSHTYKDPAQMVSFDNQYFRLKKRHENMKLSWILGTIQNKTTPTYPPRPSERNQQQFHK